MALFELTGCDLCPRKSTWPKLRYPKKIPLGFVSSAHKPIILVVTSWLSEETDDSDWHLGRKAAKYLADAIPDEHLVNIVMTSAVRCSGKSEPSATEINCCSVYLKEEIEKLKPDYILTLGNIALQHFAPGRSATHFRGVSFPFRVSWDHNAWVFSCIDPMTISRGGRELRDGTETNPLLTAFKNDMVKFWKLVESGKKPFTESTPFLCYPKTREEAETIWKLLGQRIAVDYETFKLRPYNRDAKLLTAAFSDGATTFAIPIWWPGVDCSWQMQFLLDKLNEQKEWIAQNAGFECAWSQYFTKERRLWHDTMVQGRLYHHRNIILGVEDLSLIHLGIDVKALSTVKGIAVLSHPLDQVLRYNAYDAWAEARIDACLFAQVKGTNYNRLLLAIQSGVDMELTGIDVDIHATKRISDDLNTKITIIEENIAKQPEVLAWQKDNGRFFNIASNVDLPQVLVKYCKATLPKTDAGNYSTAEEALSKIADDILMAKLTLEFRDVNKLKSTYVDPILIGSLLGIDRKLHAIYKALGTITGRLSSEFPNMQNFPKRKHREIRRQVVPPLGHIFASFDYGQLEARVLAMASGDPILCKAIIDKEDIHTYWLNRILELYPKYYERLKEKTNETEKKKVLKGGRDIIKTDFVFASFYGSLVDAVVARTGIPYDIAEKVLDEFWTRYAGVRKWIDQQFINYAKTGVIETLTGFKRDEIIWGNEPINSPIQGTAAHIVIEAQNALWDMGISEFALMPRINVHDDLTFILPEVDAFSYIETIGEEMVKPRFDFITVPLLVECKVGTNWADMDEIWKLEGDYRRCS